MGKPGSVRGFPSLIDEDPVRKRGLVRNKEGTNATQTKRVRATVEGGPVPSPFPVCLVGDTSHTSSIARKGKSSEPLDESSLHV